MGGGGDFDGLAWEGKGLDWTGWLCDHEGLDKMKARDKYPDGIGRR